MMTREAPLKVKEAHATLFDAYRQFYQQTPDIVFAKSFFR